MGALLAARYGILHNNKIKSLVLLHPPIYKNGGEVRRTLRSTGLHYRILLDSQFRRFGWFAVQLLLPHQIARHNHASREGSLRNVIEATELQSDLRRLKTRTMLLIGLKDRQEYIHNLSELPVNKLLSVVTENVAHHSPLFQPVLIQKILLKFLL
jgi:pimeloyl-ACP methyl ester carboxylesterase